MSSFSWDTFKSGSPAIGLLFAAASFVGFEATTIYSEEAKRPERTIPRATYAAVLTIGVFFLITSWLMVNAYGGIKISLRYSDPLLSPRSGADADLFDLGSPEGVPVLPLE